MSSTNNSSYRGQVIRVAVPSPLRRLFDYLPGSHIAIDSVQSGMRVLVPFGSRKLTGIVFDVAMGSSLALKQLKPLISVLDSEPLFSPAMLRVLQWAASYYQHPVGEVFGSALPAKLRAGGLHKPASKQWRPDKAPSKEDLQSLARAKKQHRLLEFLQLIGAATVEQCEKAGFGRRLLQELARKNLIIEEHEGIRPGKGFDPLSPVTRFEIKLNAEQHSAVTMMQQSLGGFSCFLLDGITGSGKTEVYMRLMQDRLEKGKQCLILVPEIGLTPQTVSRFEKRFPCPVVTLHSGLSDTERLNAWNRARDGEAGIIIGTRSAIFTPMANPGLIVIDEEHDSSFKQQDGFRYSARDLGVIRAREENICIVLGSATPSLESQQNAQSQKFTHLQLPNRAGPASTAAIEIVDIATQSLTAGFSELLLYKIEKHLQDKNQVLVFINRRGFAPILECQNCAWTYECEHCIAQLTLHSKPPSMRCHHCGATKGVPTHCPRCQSKQLASLGIGTQKIEKFLAERFPQTPVLRMDRDSVRSKNSLADLLAKVHEGEPCILLGTQMLAKGHHFPNITLAAILDADVGLFSADFRGQEHMAQTIIQVAGRAGRALRNGEVLLQSRHAGHPVLQCLARGHYADFSALLLREREQSGMPPFAHLSLIRAESRNIEQPLGFLRRVRAVAEELIAVGGLAVNLTGPLPAPMEKRAGRYRVQLLLRSRQRGALQDTVSRLCNYMETSKQPAKLRWSVDVDPQDLI